MHDAGPVVSRQVSFNPYFISYTNINLKGIPDVHIEAKTIKLLEESLGRKSL